MTSPRESEPLLARQRDTDTSRSVNGSPHLSAGPHDGGISHSESRPAHPHPQPRFAQPRPRSARISRHHNLANLPAFQFRLLCLSIWTGTFLSALDGTIIATLLTPIGSSFNASNQTSWLGTSYLLSVCAFTPIYGRLADLAGRRAAHITALTFFTLGTIFCALAPTMNTLIMARGLAGIGGGGINTVGVITMTDLVDLRRRGMFQGYANIFFGLGAAMGGPVGGWISDTIGWRGAFWVQPPLLLAAGVGVWVNDKHTKPVSPTTAKLHDDYRSIDNRDYDDEDDDEIEGQGHEVKDEESWKSKLAQVDWAGLVLLVVAVGSLLLGMSFKTSSRTRSGDEYPWSSPWIYAPLLLSALTTSLFILVEHSFAFQPILPLSLLARRTPLGVALSNFFMTLSQFSLLYNVPLYFATIHGNTSSLAGAHLLPNSVMICFGSLAVGYIMRRTGRYWTLTLVCSALIVLSCVRLCFWTRENTGTGRGWSWTWVDVMPGGFGYAGVLTTSLVGLMSDVTREGKGEQAVATSMSYLFRYIGQVLGVAFSSAILQSVLQRDLARTITGSDAKEVISKIRHSTSSIHSLPAVQREAAIEAYSHALHIIFIVNLIWSVMAVGGVCVMKDEAMPDISKSSSSSSSSSSSPAEPAEPTGSSSSPLTSHAGHRHEEDGERGV